MPCGGAPDWEDKLPDEISDTIFCRSKAGKSSCQKSNVQICKEFTKNRLDSVGFLNLPIPNISHREILLLQVLQLNVVLWSL